jgi:predicted secreted Zn-dependent protease
MKRSRRSFVSIAVVVGSATAVQSLAQPAGRASAATRSLHADAEQRLGTQALVDPMVAIERQLPSLRADLALTGVQTPLFDRFEHEVRAAAEDGRIRGRHLATLRSDDGGAITADKVLGTIAADDMQCAGASRQVLQRMNTLRAALTAAQQKRFDQRVVQSLREPLGTS